MPLPAVYSFVCIERRGKLYAIEKFSIITMYLRKFVSQFIEEDKHSILWILQSINFVTHKFTFEENTASTPHCFYTMYKQHGIFSCMQEDCMIVYANVRFVKHYRKCTFSCYLKKKRNDFNTLEIYDYTFHWLIFLVLRCNYCASIAILLLD